MVRVVFLETLTQSDAMINAMARHAPVAQLQVLWLRMARLDPKLLSRSSVAFADVSCGDAKMCRVGSAAYSRPSVHSRPPAHRHFVTHT